MNHSAKKLCLCAFLLLGLAFPLAAADLDFKVGGLNMTLPGPGQDFEEVGDRLRTTVFDLLAPSTNRLVSAYVPTKTLEEMNSGKTGGLTLYALVEVPRQAEYIDCPPEGFLEVLKSIEPALGKLETLKDVETEMNLRLKSRGTKPIEIGRPEMLGAIFQKTDAAGFAMLTAFKQEDHDVTMAGATLFLRVKKRLVFAYLFRRYESPETVNTLRKEVEAWADALLAKNRD